MARWRWVIFRWVRKGAFYRNFKVTFSCTFGLAAASRPVILYDFNLDNLLIRGCYWLREYLKNPNNGLSKNDTRRHICNGVKPSSTWLIEEGEDLVQKGEINRAIAAMWMPSGSDRILDERKMRSLYPILETYCLFLS